MSPKQPHTELQEEPRNGDYQPTPDTRIAELEAENQRLREALTRAGDFCERPTACGALIAAASARSRKRAGGALTFSPARRAAAHTAILNLLAQHHPDAADTTTHGGTGEPRALADDAAAYTDAAINALTGGA